MYKARPEIEVGSYVEFWDEFKHGTTIEKVVARGDWMVKVESGLTLNILLVRKSEAPVLFGEDLLD